MKLLIFPLLIIAMLPTHSAAQDLQAGLSAFEEQDYDLAVTELRPLAENGNVRAQSILGSIYTTNYPPDYVQAERWNRIAGSKGDQDAQFLLAYAFMEGWGVQQNNRAAHVWFNLAARYGNHQAASFRDQIGNALSRYDLSAAMRDALICIETNYDTCP